MILSANFRTLSRSISSSSVAPNLSLGLFRFVTKEGVVFPEGVLVHDAIQHSIDESLLSLLDLGELLGQGGSQLSHVALALNPH